MVCELSAEYRDQELGDGRGPGAAVATAMGQAEVMARGLESSGGNSQGPCDNGGEKGICKIDGVVPYVIFSFQGCAQDGIY